MLGTLQVHDVTGIDFRNLRQFVVAQGPIPVCVILRGYVAQVLIREVGFVNLHAGLCTCQSKGKRG